jgi:signal transduction histidine kinase
VPPVALWSLRRRLAAAIAVLAAGLLALVVVAALLLVSVRSQQHAVINRYFTAVNVANTRFVEQLDAETAVRGYALTGVSSTLQPIQLLRSASYSAQDARLRVLLAGDRQTMAALDRWDRAATTWYDTWAKPTLVEVAGHGRGSVTAKQVLTGKALFDHNRASYSAFSRVLVAKRNATSQSLKFRTTLLFVAALLVAAALAITGGLSWWALRRWVLVPLGALGAETRLVRAGELEHAVTVDGPTEIRDLAADVDQMRRDIVGQLEAVKQAQAEIEAARQRVEEQAEDLERSNRDLEQFAYVASHDLQEPLRKVASFCQMLQQRYRGQLDERADQYIAFAVDGAKRMQQLINDLLAFSRVGRLDSPLMESDLQICLAAALENLSVAVDSSGAVVSSDRLPRVLGDSGLLTQLLQNLIGNALKFRGVDAPRVVITARRTGEFWEFGCADNGLGIEPQYAERIFIIFQRLHAKDEYTGTGIGLALCKRIVEHHGGQIWLDETASPGATFHWTLPAYDKPAAQPGIDTDSRDPVETS